MFVNSAYMGIEQVNPERENTVLGRAGIKPAKTVGNDSNLYFARAN